MWSPNFRLVFKFPEAYEAMISFDTSIGLDFQKLVLQKLFLNRFFHKTCGPSPLLVLLKNMLCVKSSLPASKSNCNAFVSGAGGLRLKSRASQIGHSVANGSPRLRHFFKRSYVARAQWHGDGPRQLVTRFGVLQQYNERFD